MGYLLGISPLLLWGQREIRLPFSATLFTVDGLYNLYLWSQEERALYKFWAPAYDSLTRIGGAPGGEGFLSITSIAPVGNQQLYVLDAAGQVVTLLGTNLQPLQKLSYDQLPPEVRSNFPILMAVGQAGELYLLLRETQEVVKIDFFGRVLLRFGGRLFGAGRLVAPSIIHADGGRLFVTDTILRQIIEYDEWGNFLEATPFPSSAHTGVGFTLGKFFWRDSVGWWYPSQGNSHTITFPAYPQQVVVRGNRLYWMARDRLGWYPLP
ncbi:MAG: hypothetical protein RMJ66_07375 [Bacteroidia bacterium]|nr:hypothetical protein [Bacteroidia bacterium]MDW8134874.1 hypothetical protein [Bacteroidia bacterium]